jgi:hypothetical protein
MVAKDMAIRIKMRVIMPESLESGKCISGADIQALWHTWNAGEIPDPTNGDEVVQPKEKSLGSWP